jgi:hypothetical protein
LALASTPTPRVCSSANLSQTISGLGDSAIHATCTNQSINPLQNGDPPFWSRGERGEGPGRLGIHQILLYILQPLLQTQIIRKTVAIAFRIRRWVGRPPPTTQWDSQIAPFFACTNSDLLSTKISNQLTFYSDFWSNFEAQCLEALPDPAQLVSNFRQYGPSGVTNFISDSVSFENNGLREPHDLNLSNAFPSRRTPTLV